ncbi:MAG: hypothetical protein IKT63_01010 [Oscillospiraceae bacterium]|nr:hypothetical protein [Oscillospiraceae bacterium]
MSIAKFKKFSKICRIFDIFVRKGYLRDISAPFCYNKTSKRGDFMPWCNSAAVRICRRQKQCCCEKTQLMYHQKSLYKPSFSNKGWFCFYIDDIINTSTFCEVYYGKENTPHLSAGNTF